MAVQVSLRCVDLQPLVYTQESSLAGLISIETTQVQIPTEYGFFFLHIHASSGYLSYVLLLITVLTGCEVKFQSSFNFYFPDS